MIATDEINAHVEASMSTLEELVRDGDTFSPMLMVYRGEFMVAQVMPQNPGPDVDPGAVLEFVGQLCAQLFRATDLLIVMDAYCATGPTMTNPLTGKEWQHGDMARLAEQHDGRAKGWVSDALTLILQDRDGAEALIELPYRLEGRRVRWGREQRFGLGSPDTHRVGQGRLSGLFTPPPGMPSVPSTMTDLDAAKLITVADCLVALAVRTDHPESRKN